MATSSNKLYKEALNGMSSQYNISLQRKQCIAHSNGYLCLPSNEKAFNYDKIKKAKHFKKYDKKHSYNTVNLKRHDETDRMKMERHIGSKKLRNFLKRETNNLINEDLNE